jgi:hypothetical protein
MPADPDPFLKPPLSPFIEKLHFRVPKSLGNIADSGLKKMIISANK